MGDPTTPLKARSPAARRRVSAHGRAYDLDGLDCPSPGETGRGCPDAAVGEPGVISIRRISLGGGYRYLMDSVAVGDGAAERSNGLTRYYPSSGTPPGVFLGAGLAELEGGRGGRGSDDRARRSRDGPRRRGAQRGGHRAVTGFLIAVTMLMAWQNFASDRMPGSGSVPRFREPEGASGTIPRPRLQRKAAADWLMSSSNRTVSSPCVDALPPLPLRRRSSALRTPPC